MITLHSNDVRLDEPETPLHKMVNQHIDVIYRPREEKEENVKYKEERKKAEKSDSPGLFDISEESEEKEIDNEKGSEPEVETTPEDPEV